MASQTNPRAAGIRANSGHDATGGPRLADPTPARDRPLFGVIGHVAGVFVEHPKKQSGSILSKILKQLFHF
jgi:hypothetical protein